MKYLVIFVLVLCLGCNMDADPAGMTYPENSLLQRVLLYSSPDGKEPIAVVEEYSYDAQDRIIKVSTPMYIDGKISGTAKYDEYSYGTDGRLEQIASFHANPNFPSGYINLSTQRISYNADGFISRSETAYPEINDAEYVLYSYKNRILEKEERFNKRDQLQSSTVYLYQGGKVTKENTFSPTGELMSVKEHAYQKGLQTQTLVYAGAKREKVREIHRSYDTNGNLLMLKSTEMASWSSVMSFVMRYEY